MSQIEPVIGRFERSGTGPFPFVGVAEAFAHGPAYFRGFPGAHPDDRVDAGNVGKLKLINADACVFGIFQGRIVKGGHVSGPAEFFEFFVLIPDSKQGEFFLALLRSHRVTGYSRIALADIAGFRKNSADGLHLIIGEPVDSLELFE